MVQDHLKVEHIPRARCSASICKDESFSSKHVPVDDLYLHIVLALGCVQEQKARHQQWVVSIGVGNKCDAHGPCQMIQSITKPVFQRFLLIFCLLVAQMSRSPDLVML
jgi:hypothetical protein